jgi:uncharacterized protein YcbX
MTVSLQKIYRFPVKGLSGEALEHVELRAGEVLPYDRRYALARASGKVDPADPRWHSKAHFVQLMSNERAGALETSFDAASKKLVIRRQGRIIAQGVLSDPAGRVVIEQFMGAYLADKLRRQPKLVECNDASFSDVPDPYISIINTASVSDIERVAGRAVDPMRFRGNLLIDGLAPWGEFAWVGKTIAIGGARLKFAARIERCAATEVDPVTGERDLAVPLTLRRGFGHEDCGIYAQVIEGGEISTGDEIVLNPS